MSTSALTDDRVLQICLTTQVTNPPWVSAAMEDVRAFAALVIGQVRPGERLLDIGTGTGILAICAAHVGVDVVGTDISAAAVRTAQENAARNRVEFPCYASDLLEAVEGRFDVMAFNPPFSFSRNMFFTNVLKSVLRRIPWVRRSVRRSMPAAVVRFRQDMIQRLFQQAPAHLNPGGRIILHAFDFDAFREVVPPGADVQMLEHPLLKANRSAGMVIRLT